MAPKTRGPSKKRASTSQEKEKRTKRREEAPTPSHSPSGSSSRPATMGSRSVVTGRRISFQFLENEGFKLGEWLRFQGWESFCSLNIPTYPHLVREFFENIKMCDDFFWSQVKGEDIVLDQIKLKDLLDMPNEGTMYFDNISEIDAMKRLLGREDVGGLDYHNGNILPVELKLLHNMVARMFFPRTGRFDWISRRDMALMVHIIEKQPVNLPFLMMEQIKEAAQKGKVKACLPYGMVFTLLFRDAEINLKGEDTTLLGHTDLYSLQTLKRMHFRKERGVWVRDIEGGLAAPAARASSSSSSSDSSESDSDHVGVGATRAPGTPMSGVRPGSPAAPPSPVAPASPAASPSPVVGPTPPSGSAQHVPPVAASSYVRRGKIFEEHQVDTIIAALGSRFEAQIDAIGSRLDAQLTELKDSVFKRLDATDKAVSERFEALEEQMTEVIDRVLELKIDTPAPSAPQSAPSSSAIADLRGFISAELDGHRVTADGRHEDLVQRIQTLSQRLETVERLQPPPPPSDLKDLHCQITFLIRLVEQMSESQRKSLKLFVDAITQLAARIDTVMSGASTSQTLHTPGPSSTPVPPPTATMDIIPIAIRPPFSATVRPGTGFTPRPGGPSSRTRSSRPRGRGRSTAGSSAATPHEVAPSDEE